MFFCTISAQKVLPFDTLRLKEVQDMFADDYGSIYLYKNKDFSFTKYDSLGKQLGKLMFTVPFKVQNVQNPLSIPLFSENAQEMKFVDQNLNEIQKIDFKTKFTYIKYAFAEDLQQIWLIDESTKRLIQYNFRNDTTINSYPFSMNIDDLIDLMVYENKVYLLTRTQFRVYNLKFEKLFETPIESPKRFRRENENILIITQNSIFKYNVSESISPIFSDVDAKIVDKNSLTYFEIKANKLYLYNLENFEKSQDHLEPQLPAEKDETQIPTEISEVIEEIHQLGY